jgi:hypothetical protein
MLEIPRQGGYNVRNNTCFVGAKLIPWQRLSHKLGTKRTGFFMTKTWIDINGKQIVWQRGKKIKVPFSGKVVVMKDKGYGFEIEIEDNSKTKIIKLSHDIPDSK